MKKLIIYFMILSIVMPIKVFAANSTSDTVTLNNCVDGNSARFMLGLGEIKVKFLGIEVEEKIVNEETQEIEENFVSDYVCNALTKAKTIKIEYEPNAEKEDKYGRIQAWVFIDGTLLQETLVKKGYAKVMYLSDDYLYTEKLKDAQSFAKENKLGIWKDDVEEKQEEVIEVVEEKKSKGFFESIFDFFAGLFEKILKFIDDIISNIL